MKIFLSFFRYEFLEKLLERSIRTDIQTQEYNKAVEKALGSIKGKINAKITLKQEVYFKKMPADTYVIPDPVFREFVFCVETHLGWKFLAQKRLIQQHCSHSSISLKWSQCYFLLHRHSLIIQIVVRLLTGEKKKKKNNKRKKSIKEIFILAHL